MYYTLGGTRYADAQATGLAYKANPTLGFLGDEFGALGQDDTTTTPTDTSTSPAWLTNLSQGVTQFFLAKQQSDRIAQLNQINIQRAAAGLPPLTVDMMGPSVSVGVAPGTQQLLIYGAIGIGALIALNMFMKRRG